MAAPRLDALIGQIEKLSGGSCESPGTDRQLLDDFAARHDETAFAELVARHGPLVLRVCRRVLHHEQDAEDAFQATFLVLAQNLGSIRKREALADWLHGVAYRTAMKAKRTAARRRNHETQMRERTPAAATSPTWDDVQAVLDKEIQRLPAVYRSAFVLCVLEGKTIAAVGVELGCKDGTIATRVMRARQRLQQQLSRRGIKLAALLAALCVAEGVAKAVPATLGQTVIRNGLLVAAGGSAAGAVPSHIAALATGVTRAMFLQKAKIAVVVLLTLGLFATGAGVLTHQLLKAEEKPSIVQPAVKPPAEPAKPAEDTVEVTGRVLDPDGKPVAKARLYQPRFFKDYSERPEDYDAVALGVTDGEGRFQVKMVRPSSTAIGPIYFYLLAAADGFGFNWVELPKQSQPDEVTLRLVKDQLVRGRLINTEGMPVVGVTVDCYIVWPLPPLLTWLENDYGKRVAPQAVQTAFKKVVRVSATDKDGRFEITGLGIERGALVYVHNGSVVMPHSLIVTREGFDPKAFLAKTREKPHWLLYGPSFEWVVLPTRSIEGIVTEAGTDKPVAGARVWATAKWGTAEAVTDAKGRYRLNGLTKADTYSLSFTPDKATALFNRWVKVADGPGLETLTCNVELSRGVLITGRIVDKATGKGVRSQVNYVLLPDNPFAAKDADLSHREFQVWSDPDGSFRLVIHPGPGVLLARKLGVYTHKVEEIEVNPYKVAEFDEADRKRVKVAKKSNPGAGSRYFSRSDGGWVFLDTYNVCKVLDLKGDGKPVVCDLAFELGKQRTVKLENPDGKPLTEVVVSGLGALSGSYALLKAPTCPVYAFDAERPRQLAFLHKERKLAALVTVHGDDHDPLTVRLAPTAVVSGRLLDPNGQPLAGARILLEYVDSDALLTLSAMDESPKPLTDKDGRFRLEGVFADEKFVIYATKSKLTAETAAHEPLKAGEVTDLGDIRAKARNP